MIKKPEEHYCLVDAPMQHGDLWVAVSGDTVRVLDPAGAWWRGRSFTQEEFRAAYAQAKVLHNEKAR